MTPGYLFWVAEYPEEGGSRGSDRELDFGLTGLDPGEDAQCVLGVSGPGPEMCE